MKSVALYARVSSEAQEKNATVESQVVALRERAKADGHVVLPTDIYIDNGYSGSSLVRPALEKLRDRAADGELDLLYVHSPDRLARRYAYQVLLLEELSRCRVLVQFLNGTMGNTAEDQLLVQVQGMIAEYERAKILERSRRGKLHKARTGSVNPMSGAPYGFQYVCKTADEPARYQVLLHEAKVVRQIFDWFVTEQMSMLAITRRLNAEQIPTRRGGPRWGTTAVWNILRNPAVAGRAAFGKTQYVAKSVMLRPPRGRSGISRKTKSSAKPKPSSQWVFIPVPAIIAEETFAAAQEQLERNARFSPRNCSPRRYLLQGLTVCARCGYAWYGRKQSYRLKKTGERRYHYRCGGTDGHRFGGTPICRVRGVRVDQLDEYVWTSVRQVLQEPERVLEEWTRRGAEDGVLAEAHRQRDEAQRFLTAQQQALRRVQDAYEAGAMTVGELTERSERVRARIRRAEQDFEQALALLAQTAQLRALAGKLNTFADQIRAGLDELDWNGRQQVIRTLVSRVEIDDDGATIVYRIPTPRHPGEPDRDGGGGDHPTGDRSDSQLHSGGEYAVEPGEVEVGRGHQGAEPGDEVERVEHDGARAIGPRPLHVVAHPAVR
jgi:site-specific DNA recombinase